MTARRPNPSRIFASLPFALALFALSPAIAQQQSSAPPAAKTHAASNYAHIPLGFEANRGQSDPSVQYLAHGRGYTLLLRQGEAVLGLQGRNTAAPNAAPQRNPVANRGETSVVHMQLAGANLHAAAHAEDAQITRTNYFIGNDPAKWRTDIPNYSRIRYSDIYPGIDLVYYGNQSRLEHDFVVTPGANPALIRLALTGTRDARIDPTTGDLILRAGSGEIRLLKPVTYQQSSGRRTAIPSSYKLLAGHRIGFSLGTYNHSQPLVIDPVLVYSTYLGGPGPFTGGGLPNFVWDLSDPGTDWIYGVTIDSKGSAYLAGETFSPSFPVTSGAYQSADGDTVNSITGFVAKMDPTGSFLEYATYLGGSNGEACTSIAIDASGDAYVAGVTESTDFPVTTGAFQSTNVDSVAGSFVAELNPTGTALIYSTYLGGSGDGAFGDYAYAIAVDGSGSAYVAGLASSKNFPVTKGAFQTVGKATQWNGFVTKFNPTGTNLIYSTYLSGSSSDFASAIVVDSSGHAYVTGLADSPDFPVTKGAFQTTLKSPFGGQGNAFVTKLNSAGSGLVYSTFLGGSSPNYDQGLGITVNSAGEVYLTGTTCSFDFPITTGAFQSTDKDPSELFTGFVTKFNSTGSALIYSTYIGGSNIDFGTAIAIDASGNAYITGLSNSTDYPITPNAFQTANFGNYDAFFTEINPAGNALVYSTFLGGPGGNTLGNGIAVDSSGNVYVAGSATPGFPVLPGAFQASVPADSSGDVGFVVKLDPSAATGGKSTSTMLTATGLVALVPFALNAAVAATGGSIPSGSVDFRIDGQIVATVALNGSGKASYSSAAVSAGSHAFAANYEGSSTFNPSAGGLLVAFANPTPVVLTGNKQRVAYGTPFPIPLTVQLTANGQAASVSGIPINFSGTGVSFASQTVMTDANGQAQAIATPTLHGPVVAMASVPNNPTTAEFKLLCLYGRLLIAPAPFPVISYGETVPAPTGFRILEGLANGDTQATAVTGEPILTLDATSTSPVGVYQIHIERGTLASPNYQLIFWPGPAQIYKAWLTVTANSFTITQGQPVPALTYTITGFFNNDNQSVVSGAPVLSTTATSSSPSGTYPVTVTKGTLYSTNYDFPTMVAGTITIQTP